MVKNDLIITLGSIAELCGMIENTTEKYNRLIKQINEDNTRVANWKNEQIDIYKNKYNSDINSIYKDIKNNLTKLREHIGQPFEYNPQLAQSIDYLQTMQKAKALNPNMINMEIEKYRGNESALLYLRAKADEVGINTSLFDNAMFSRYETDVNGNTQFIAPTQYIEELEQVINNGNPISISSALRQTENILGVSSNGLNEYESKVAESNMTEIPPII